MPLFHISDNRGRSSCQNLKYWKLEIHAAFYWFSNDCQSNGLFILFIVDGQRWIWLELTLKILLKKRGFEKLPGPLHLFKATYTHSAEQRMQWTKGFWHLWRGNIFSMDWIYSLVTHQINLNFPFFSLFPFYHLPFFVEIKQKKPILTDPTALILYTTPS